ncbi:S8 family serine peptidase [Saccharothrix coeruleofusca]|uniref:S8 family serine peptidase n=1 Tax=Saccharothrix coeruleofusca TaxID=33919 RepID=UPI001E59E841|nr:S8 family serine peptidase [Saccharothrix coeruleofusca]
MSAAPATPAAAAEEQATRSYSVTLVTGDRVLLNGDRVVSITGGAGREKTAFRTFQRDGRTHVLPLDAIRPLAEGRLDLRLFDVTGLVEAGYDDARRDDVPLLVTRSDARSPELSGLRMTRELPAVGAFAATTSKATAAATWPSLLADAGVAKVWLDGVRHPVLDRSTAQIGAPTAWEAGYTGRGVKVAVIDSGVDGAHPDLVGREIAEANFSDEPDNTDTVGHGTHVAAIVASAGAQYRGVAPEAQLLDAKVCGLRACQESGIIAGMQWAAEQGADVANISLGGTDTPGTDPLEKALNTLSAQYGVVFVVSAGNSGRAESVGSPGSADAALTVGAVDRDDSIAPFSSRGPRVGDGAVKPDITAPGVDIVAAKSSTGVIGTPVGERHVAVSGTSMSAPHVAGAAALLAQQHPDWTGAQLKAALMASAKHNPALTVLDQGTGRVDVAEAISTAVTADPPSLSLGVQQWPHEDDVPVTADFTLRNTGSAPATFTLTVESKGPDGQPAPAGLFTVSPAEVTVPAGGEAKATATADTRLGSLDGVYAGTVVATSESDALRVPFAVTREVESYDVAIQHISREGDPEDEYDTLIIGLDNDRVIFLSGPDETGTVRLPKGRYTAMSEFRFGHDDNTLLLRPDLDVSTATTVVFDARTAGPLRIDPPDPAATAEFGSIATSRFYRGLGIGFGSTYPGGFPPGMTIGHSGPALPADEYEVVIGTEFSQPREEGTPVWYRSLWIEQGRAPTGFTRTPSVDEMAKVETKFGPAREGRQYWHYSSPITASGTPGFTTGRPVPPLSSTIDYVSAEGFSWGWTSFQETAEDTEAVQIAQLTSYLAGRTYSEAFHFPVFGVTAPHKDDPYPYLFRSGDRVVADVWLFGDQANHRGDTIALDHARTTLFRDGEKVGETTLPGVGNFAVAPGAAEYRVEAEASRPATVSEFGTTVSGSWTFRSDTTPEDRRTLLPLTVVRFAPTLDETGAAPANRLLRVPLVVGQQADAGSGHIRRLRAEVSFDEGKTWSAVPVTGRTALVRNTAAAGSYASLRVQTTDSKGNSSQQTVIRAYRIS